MGSLCGTRSRGRVVPREREGTRIGTERYRSRWRQGFAPECSRPVVNDDEEMTLAFALEAVEQLSAPDEVFDEAREWSAGVGIVSDRPRAIQRFVREHGLRQDFFPGERNAAESLALAARRFDTDRHVFVGTGEGHRRIAEATGWEYLDVEEAAERAAWVLCDPDDGTGPAVLDRLAGWLGLQ